MCVRKGGRERERAQQIEVEDDVLDVDFISTGSDSLTLKESDFQSIEN